MNALLDIQTRLKATKESYNSFGKYKYRTAEQIEAALKPLLKEHDAVMTLSDDLLEVAGRWYIKATCTLSVDGQTFVTTAYAREEEEKKGMDASQVTGGSSSYARKYAMCGMFLIDDTPDSDQTNTRSKDDPVKGKKGAAAPVSSSLDAAKKALEKCESSDAVANLWRAMPELQGNEEWKALVGKRGSELKGKEGKA